MSPLFTMVPLSFPPILCEQNLAYPLLPILLLDFPRAGLRSRSCMVNHNPLARNREDSSAHSSSINGSMSRCRRSALVLVGCQFLLFCLIMGGPSAKSESSGCAFHLVPVVLVNSSVDYALTALFIGCCLGRVVCSLWYFVGRYVSSTSEKFRQAHLGSWVSWLTIYVLGVHGCQYWAKRKKPQEASKISPTAENSTTSPASVPIKKRLTCNQMIAFGVLAAILGLYNAQFSVALSGPCTTPNLVVFVAALAIWDAVTIPTMIYFPKLICDLQDCDIFIEGNQVLSKALAARRLLIHEDEAFTTEFVVAKCEFDSRQWASEEEVLAWFHTNYDLRGKAARRSEYAIDVPSNNVKQPTLLACEFHDDLIRSSQPWSRRVTVRSGVGDEVAASLEFSFVSRCGLVALQLVATELGLGLEIVKGIAGLVDNASQPTSKTGCSSSEVDVDDKNSSFLGIGVCRGSVTFNLSDGAGAAVEAFNSSSSEQEKGDAGCSLVYCRGLTGCAHALLLFHSARSRVEAFYLYNVLTFGFLFSFQCAIMYLTPTAGVSANFSGLFIIVSGLHFLFASLLLNDHAVVRPRREDVGLGNWLGYLIASTALPIGAAVVLFLQLQTPSNVGPTTFQTSIPFVQAVHFLNARNVWGPFWASSWPSIASTGIALISISISAILLHRQDFLLGLSLPAVYFASQVVVMYFARRVIDYRKMKKHEKGGPSSSQSDMHVPLISRREEQ